MKKLSIYLMLAFAGLFITSCGLEDNEFVGLKTAEAEGSVVVPGFTAGQVGLIDLNTVEVSSAQDVKAFTVTETALPEGVELSKAEIVFEDGTVMSATADGKVSGETLSAYVASIYGRRPEARTVAGNVYLYAMQNGAAVKIDAGKVSFQVVPKAPVIEEAYYITGNINGWDNTDTTYELKNGGGDVYEDPIFKIRIPAGLVEGNYEFKLTPKSGLGGDWSKCLTASATSGRFEFDNVGGNIVIEPVEGAKFYDLAFDLLNQTYNVTAVSFDPFVFFIGATDGWKASEQRLALTGEGHYSGYLYIADPNGWGVAFKFQKEAGNWDSQVNASNVTIEGDFIYDGNGDQNFVASAGEGVYFVELDLVNLTLKGTLVKTMGIIGDFNGWGGDVEMTWNAEDFCYEATGAGVTANGWKFRINNDWGINLGSNDSVEPSTILNDLVANGKNIGVAGSTIKLYPTRKTNDNIYCTVE